MFFGRRKQRRPHTASAAESPTAPELFVVHQADMVKGFMVTRGRKQVRQCAVMMDGSPRLVTSGDTVDRCTYEALLAAGIVRPTSPTPNGEVSGDQKGG